MVIFGGSDGVEFLFMVVGLMVIRKED